MATPEQLVPSLHQLILPNQGRKKKSTIPHFSINEMGNGTRIEIHLQFREHKHCKAQDQPIRTLLTSLQWAFVRKSGCSKLRSLSLLFSKIPAIFI